jgi:hypothetical protein
MWSGRKSNRVPPEYRTFRIIIIIIITRVSMQKQPHGSANFRSSFCYNLCVWMCIPTFVLSDGQGIHGTTKELLDESFSIPKAADQVFTETLRNTRRAVSMLVYEYIDYYYYGNNKNKKYVRKIINCHLITCQMYFPLIHFAISHSNRVRPWFVGMMPCNVE